jgi:hypothetical protein
MIDNAVERGTGARARFEPSWLLVRDNLGSAGCPPEVLTLGDGGESNESILPVFSFGEEARLFLRLCGFGGSWRVSKSSAAHLASVLSDACPDAQRVALDPIPEIGECGPYDLVALPRKEFVRLLAAGR